jgi:phenylalanine-4-hydroxylase
MSRVVQVAPVAQATVAIREDHLVQLEADHPGFRDPVYRRRRDEIAAVALAHLPGAPVQRVEYTDAENAIWPIVHERLEPLHQAHACQEFLRIQRDLDLGDDQIPQLADVNRRLADRSGFQMVPAPGMVEPRRFFAALREGCFLSTQYIRHASTPLFTPEPDVIHELIGHSVKLCDPAFASLNCAFGAAADGVDADTLERIARVYWFTVEVGIVDEAGRPKVFGASLLSSSGELEGFTSRDLRRFDLDEIAETFFDVTTYQDKFFVAPSFEHMLRETTRWLCTEGERARGKAARGKAAGPRRLSACP